MSSRHAPPDKRLSAWVAALEKRDTTELKRLAKKGPPPTHPDGTPLLHRVRTRTETELLLLCGADPAAVDAQGRTPLHEAARRLCMPVLTRLLEEGVYAGTRCQKGRTPLHEAARSERADGKARDIVQRLVDAQVPVDALDHKKRTAGHYAARAGRAGVILALRKAGARFDIEDTDGVRATDFLNRKSVKMSFTRFMLAQDAHAGVPKAVVAPEPPVPVQVRRRNGAGAL